MLPKKTLFKVLASYLAVAMVILSLPAQGWAMFIPSSGADAIRKADMAAIQKTVESTVVKQRLMDYGLSSDEAMARINKLSDEQIHQFAAQLNSLQAGADDGADALIFILLVAILVILILELTGHHVIVR
jgi:uncharacterized protein DUF6627